MPGPKESGSLSLTLPTTTEPPRKRQRTVERELAPASPRHTSGIASPTPAAELLTPSQSTSVSLPGPNAHARMSHSLTGDAPASALLASGSGNASLSNMFHSASSSGSGADSEASSAARGSGTYPDGPANDDQGGVPSIMKGVQKGKAREGAHQSSSSSPSPSSSSSPSSTSSADISPAAMSSDEGHSLDGAGDRMVWDPIPGNGTYAPSSCVGGAEVNRWQCERTAGGAHSVQKSSEGQPRVDGCPGVPDEDPPVRDVEFYIDSADCVIRVQDTLFRVHRFFLGRDSSAFQHMFSMPAEDIPHHRMEGYSDDNPIQLYGESVDRFRALLSVIYALPMQLQMYNTPAANVDQLLTIAEMTNKYHFTSIETWAVDALYNVISGLHGPPQQEYELGQCSSSWMRRLLEVALLCGHTPLRNYVADRWVDRIVARDLRPVHALEIADGSRIRKLQGYAYYIQLLEMGDNFDPGVVEDGKQYSRSRLGTQGGNGAAAAGGGGGGPPLPGEANNNGTGGRQGTPATLSREQKQRLLSGHWSLARLWDTLRTDSPKFQRSDGCTYHQHGCLATWNQVWREVGMSELTFKYRAVDVLGRLRAMQEQLCVNPDLSCALTPPCKRGALAALKSTIKDVQDGLADHFMDLTATTATTETGPLLEAGDVTSSV